MVRPIDHPPLLNYIVIPPLRAKFVRILAVQVKISVHSESGKGHEGTFWDQNGIFTAVAATTWEKCVLCGKAAIQRYRWKQPQGCKGDIVSCQSPQFVQARLRNSLSQMKRSSLSIAFNSAFSGFRDLSNPNMDSISSINSAINKGSLARA